MHQRRLELAPEATAVPLVTAALPYVGHRELRNRGTVCGSLAHADPAAELPAVAVTLDAILTIRSPAGEREVRARDFFVGPFETVLHDDELLTSVRLPVARPGDGYAFDEVARRHGDFALCGVAAAVHRDRRRLTSATVGLFGVAGTPLAIDATDAVRRAGSNERLLSRLGEQIATKLTPPDDLHASAGYRRRLAAVLVARCLKRALVNVGDKPDT